MLASAASPSPWLTRFAPGIPPGRVLDLACGSGRHARWLAAAGHTVLAVDRDANLLDDLSAPGIATQCIDLESPSSALDQLLSADSYAGIIVTNYLHRPLLPALFGSLSDGGILIYETFAEGNAAYGKPSNPDFLLRAGELLEAVAQAQGRLHVIAFEDGVTLQPTPKRVQRLCAVRSDAPLRTTALYL